MGEVRNEMFLSAARSGNLVRLKGFLEEDRAILNEAKTPLLSETALHLAAQYGHLIIVSFLLEQPDLDFLPHFHFVLNRDETNKKEWTMPSPLLVAAKEGHLEVVEEIMNFLFRTLALHPGMEGHLHYQMYTEPIKWAIRYGHNHLVRFLVSHSHVVGKDTLDSEGFSLLHWAAHMANPPIMRLLLESGLTLTRQQNIGLFSKEGLTPLHSAAQSGCIETAQLLIQNNAATPNAGLEDRTKPEGFTPLHIAANAGHLEMVSFLLVSMQDAKVDPIVAVDCMGRTPLHYAAREGHHLVVNKLLKCSEFDVAVADWDGFTPLHMAARRGHAKVIAELLRSSTDHLHARARHSINLKAQFDDTFATNIVRIATNYFPRPKLIDSMFWMTEGFTALHFAARYRFLEAVEELLKHLSSSSSGGSSSSLDSLDLRDSGGFRAYEWAKVRNIEENFLEYVERYIADGVSFLTARNCVSMESWEIKIARRGVSEEEKEKETFQHALENESPILIQRLERFMDESLGIRNHGLHLGLHWAASRNSLFWTRRLLGNKDINVNEVDEEGFTPLDRAFRAKSFAVTEELIKHPGVILDHGYLRECLLELASTIVPQKSRAPFETYLIEMTKREDVQVAAGECFDWLLCWAINGEMDKLAMHLISLNVTNCTQKIVVYLVHEDAIKMVCPFDVAKDKGKDYLVKLILQRQDVKQALYEDRQVHLDCANAILVGGALVAGVAYQGWLQPPRGYSFEYQGFDYADLDNDWQMVLFWWCNSFAFFFSVATVIAGAIGSVPTDSKDVLESMNFVKRAVFLACIMFSIALVSAMVSFSAAGLAVVPPLHQPRQIMWVSVAIGFGVCIFIWLWFIRRLSRIVPKLHLPKEYLLQKGKPIDAEMLERIRGTIRL